MEVLIPYNSLLNGSEGIFGPAKEIMKKDHQKVETHLQRGKAKKPLALDASYSEGDLLHHVFRVA